MLDDNLKYPFWTKYWAFQGMVRMGNYDYISSKYTKRTKSTLSPFLDLNTKILNESMDSIIKYTNNIKLNDEILDKIINSGSFSKIYNIYCKRNNNYIKKDNNYYDGKWIKYNEGVIDDAIKLSESLKNKSTTWCTKEKNIAISQICGGDNYYGGDFYVYYTKDKNSKYTIPRIAIRMDGKDEIGEIRGVDDNQNLEEGLELILKKKIDEFDFLDKFEKLDAYKKINDQRKLTIIANKTRDNYDLNLDEKEFLYELNDNISFFGWGCNPLLIRIREEIFKKGLIINDLKDEKIRNYMINKNGNMLKYVPDEYKTKELCLRAVLNNIDAIKYVNDENKTYEFYKKILEFYPSNINIIPIKFLSNEICLNSVKNDGLSLKYIPDKYKTKEICIEAIKQNKNSIMFIPDNIKYNLPNILFKNNKKVYIKKI